MEKNGKLINNKIVKLDKALAARIAAGEVVQNPLSVVKELVENSIDAGSTNIEVNVFGGGIERIEVIDDGIGIHKDELEIAFLKHATSKLSGKDSLDEISSLGFRGEALYSIKTVAKVKLISKTKDEEVAYAINFEDKSEGSIGPDRGENGTMVIVDDLFYNTPARRKFLKSEKTELMRIMDFLTKIAITYPNIRFSYFVDGKKNFASRGDGELQNALISIIGADVFKDLIYAEASFDSDTIMTKGLSSDSYSIGVRAYISKQGRTLKSKGNQVAYVNGRYVNDATVSRAVFRAYEGFIMPGRYPISYIFVDLPPNKVDVNVHPQKTNIRFADEKFIYEAVRRVIRDRLLDGSMVGGGIDSNQVRQYKDQKDYFHLNNKNMEKFSSKKDLENSNITKAGSMTYETNEALKMYRATSALDRSSTDNGTVPKWHIDELLPPDKERENKKMQEVVADSIEESQISPMGTDTKADTISDTTPDDLQLALDIDNFSFIGNIFSTYLLFKNEEALFVVDQHAAHERINYEKLKAAGSDAIPGQLLLSPESLEIPQPKANSFFDKLESLEKIGFEVELISARTVYIRAIPSILDLSQAMQMLKDLIFATDTGKESIDDEAIIMRACRMSVKANNNLSAGEAQGLITALMQAENPYACPHGRPTMTRLEKLDIEKLFKRVL